jgi:hypothetical protein
MAIGSGRCLCDCGKYKLVSVHELRQHNMRSLCYAKKTDAELIVAWGRAW